MVIASLVEQRSETDAKDFLNLGKLFLEIRGRLAHAVQVVRKEVVDDHLGLYDIEPVVLHCIAKVKSRKSVLSILDFV